MRVKLFLLLFLSLPFLSYKSYDQDGNLLVYDVVRNGKVIGYLNANRKVEGNRSEYTMESNVKVTLLIDFSLYSKVYGEFINGVLLQGSILRQVNGKNKANASIMLNNGRYIIRDDENSSELRERIPYTTACLMHVEPTKLTRIFSENFKRFIPIHEIRPHVFELELPDGNKNYYTYSNGICVSAEVNTTLSTAYFRLKK